MLNASVQNRGKKKDTAWGHTSHCVVSISFVWRWVGGKRKHTKLSGMVENISPTAGLKTKTLLPKQKKSCSDVPEEAEPRSSLPSSNPIFREHLGFDCVHEHAVFRGSVSEGRCSYGFLPGPFFKSTPRATHVPTNFFACGAIRGWRGGRESENARKKWMNLNSGGPLTHSPFSLRQVVAAGVRHDQKTPQPEGNRKSCTTGQPTHQPYRNRFGYPHSWTSSFACILATGYRLPGFSHLPSDLFSRLSLGHYSLSPADPRRCRLQSEGDGVPKRDLRWCFELAAVYKMKAAQAPSLVFVIVVCSRHGITRHTWRAQKLSPLGKIMGSPTGGLGAVQRTGQGCGQRTAEVRRTVRNCNAPAVLHCEEKRWPHRKRAPYS
eukprot:TRINITY_DN32248_c0_g1_i1.p1 TRINITY_DN32248_c0_g1~~TRINITY_DN32248_c0_g1_i1.p1  ORF type:complete len:417 (-),score=-109.75 TRINITY_DN32248_c0_g1_i1:309-1442(-)